MPFPQAQSDPTRYYLLTATDIRLETETAGALKRWVVGVRAVEMAAYLRTRSLAVRSHTNEIMFPDFARWGEPLDQGLARVIAENLQSVQSVARVSTPPFRADEQRDFEVLIRVTACEGMAGGEVRFAATWRMLAPGAVPGTVAEGSYAASGLRWDGHDHGQLAAKLSEALAGLSREIVAALPRQPAG
ncbi:MAG: PqiC family protein [Opitutaceae bacterium]|nr:PqiC family protein [Opitutaceae bacterium]